MVDKPHHKSEENYCVSLFFFFFKISDEEEEIERLAVNFVTFSAEKWTKSAADWSRGVIFLFEVIEQNQIRKCGN